MNIPLAFPGHELNIPFNQFIMNRSVIVIPINPLFIAGEATTQDGVVNVHLDYGNKYLNGA